MSNIQGQNLIFLISQPRSGSTMTQRVLGSHTAIHTQSEPWVLLHPLHAAKPANISSAYDTNLYSLTLDIFIESLPGGINEYRETIAGAYQSFYDSILKRENKNLFLDKTPRYYHIIDELSAFFPKAKFLFLFRNPAAVFGSILKVWVKDEWNLLALYKDDLLSAPSLMLKGIEKLGSKAKVIKYEDILVDPELRFREICSFLELPFEPQMIEYGSYSHPQWRYGDKATVYESNAPVKQRKDEWKENLKNSPYRYLIRQYIEYLGEETTKHLGYPYKEIISIIDEETTGPINPKDKLDLMTLLNEEFSSKLENNLLKARIGSYKKMINVFEDKIAGYAENEKIREISVVKLNSLIDEQKKLILEKDNELNIVKKRLQQIESENVEYSDRLARNNEKIRDLELEIKQKTSNNLVQLDLLKQQLDLLNSNAKILDEYQVSLKEYSKWKETLTSILQERNQALLETKSELAKRENLIEQHNESIADLEEQMKLCRESLRKKDEQIRNLDQIQLRLHTIINQKNELLQKIEKSYSLRVGSIILWPFKVILRKNKD